MRNEEVERLSLMTGVPVSEIQKKMAKAGLQDEDFLEKARRRPRRRPAPADARPLDLFSGSGDGTGESGDLTEPPSGSGDGTGGSGDLTEPPSGISPEANGPNVAIVLARKREAPKVMPRVSQQAPSEGNRRPDRGVEGQRPWLGNSKSLFHRIMRWVLWKITGQKGPNKTSDDEVVNAAERITVPPNQAPGESKGSQRPSNQAPGESKGSQRPSNQAPGESKGPQRPFAEYEKPVMAAPQGWRYVDNGKPNLAPFEDQPKDWWRPEVGVRTTTKGKYVKDGPEKEKTADESQEEISPESDRPSRHMGPDIGTFFRSITENQVAMAIRYISFRKSYGQSMPMIYLSKSLIDEIQHEFSVTTHELMEEFKDNNIEIKIKE